MPHHIAFEGPLGSGKTFFMTMLANLWRDQANAQGGKVTLFSNFEAKDTLPMDTYEAWYEVANAHESIVMWDESQMAFNNRAWASAQSTLGTEVMMFTRKMRSIQMYATPNIGMVDTRIRGIIEILFHCRKVGDKGFEAFIYDFHNKTFLRRVFLPMSTAKKLFKLELYDTYAMVRGFPLPEKKKEVEEFWDTLNDIHDKKHGRGIYAKNRKQQIEQIANEFIIQ